MDQDNIMIDCETMSLSPRAAVVSIGAVRFDPLMGWAGGSPESEFSVNIDLSSAMSLGAEVSGDTVMWWMQQSADARAALIVGGREPLTLALVRLREWCLMNEHTHRVVPWSNGASDDLVWLREAFRMTGLALPWSYRDERCFRTLRALCDPEERMILAADAVRVEHVALEDARFQARWACEMMKGRV